MNIDPKSQTVTVTLPAAASSTVFETFAVLSRRATKRAFYINADANIANYCTVGLNVWDSKASLPSDSSHLRGTTPTIANIDHSYPGYMGSGGNGDLGNPGDTLIVYATNGATANTNPGVITVTIVESFD